MSLRRFSSGLALGSAIVAAVVGAPACSDDPVVRETMQAETSEAWARRGFTQMVGPLRSPTTPDGSDVIEVWIALPPGGVISVREEGGAPHLVLPAGTRVDRVESVREARGELRVDDVRGTRLLEGTGQEFHVLRRRGDELAGFRWPRGSALLQARVDDALDEQLRAQHEAPRRVRRLVDLNQCESCHGPSRPAALHAGSPLPNRPTDVHGFHQVEGVLSDHAPVESSRPHDPNLDDPWIRHRCADGAAPQVTIERASRRPVCADGSVPVGTLDVAAAVRAGDPHALAVCASRAFLHSHMDASARAAFAAAFSVCDNGP